MYFFATATRTFFFLSPQSLILFNGDKYEIKGWAYLLIISDPPPQISDRLLDFVFVIYQH